MGLLNVTLCVAITTVVLLLLPTIKGQRFPAEPTRIGVKILQSDPGTCPLDGDREAARNELRQNVTTIIRQLLNDQSSYQYTCGGTSGWRRVTFINITNTSTNCPPGLTLTSYSRRTCGPPGASNGCYPTTFSVGTNYSRVCGRVIGYQYAYTSAFFGGTQGAQTIDSYYLTGVSLTHGAPGQRQHIWSFAAGLSQVYDSRAVNEFCRCVTSSAPNPPSFVGNDYFCESGQTVAYSSSTSNNLFVNDPLWDGEGCVSSTCCELNNPPWFTKTLPRTTSDDIELRICLYNSVGNENTPIELIELYVQ